MTSLPDASDEYLIQQFVQGDLLAFDSLYHRHAKAVYNRVRYVIPETDVEDITQEVFLAVLRSLPTFRGEAQFGTWLRTLTNNKIAEYYRRRSRKKETMQVDLIHAERRSDHNETVSLEDCVSLYDALSALPKLYYEVIVLRLAEGMKFNEIAQFLGKDLEATKSLFRRAIFALQKTWEVKDEKDSKE